MPGLIVPPGFALAKYRFSLSGDREEMIVTLGVDNGGMGGDASGLAARLASGFAQAWGSANFPSVYTFVGVNVTMGTDGGDGPIGESTTAGFTGSSSVQPPPQNVALLVRKITAMGGRKNRGRMFFPPVIGDSGVDHVGALADSTLVAVQAIFTDWYETFTNDGGGTLEPVTPHIFHNNYGASTPPPTLITAFTLDRTVATQRRRLRR